MTISWILKPRSSFKLVTLFVALQISACSTEDFANAVTDNIVSDTSITAETTNTPNSTVSNQAAVITGNDDGRVTEDLDSNNDGLLGASGKLNISDNDVGEAAFITATVNSNYGSLNIDINGNWFYEANNSLTAIQNLNNNETLTDRLTISSLDGTTHDIVITIYGVDEPGSTAPTEPAPTEPEPTEPTPTEPEPTEPVPTEPGPTADVNLSWVAPSEREDNNPISLSEISGYKIYYGTTQGNYSNSVSINDGSAVSHVFSEFSSGTYYFVITTLDTEGRESQYSSVVQIVI